MAIKQWGNLFMRLDDGRVFIEHMVFDGPITDDDLKAIAQRINDHMGFDVAILTDNGTGKNGIRFSQSEFGLQPKRGVE